MLVRVDGGSLKFVLLDLLAGGSAMNINLKVEGHELVIQGLTSIVIEKRIDILGIEDYMDRDFSVHISPAVQLIDAKREVTISVNYNHVVDKAGTEFTSDSTNLGHVTFNQLGFRYTMDIVPERRVTLELKDCKEAKALAVNRLVSVGMKYRALEPVAKVLASTPVDIQVCKDSAYIYYSNTVVKTPLQFEDCAIGADDYKRVQSAVKDYTDMKVMVSQDTEQAFFLTGDKTIVSIPLKPLERSLIQGIESALIGMERVTTVDISQYNAILTTLAKLNKKSMVEINVCENGLLFYTNSGGASFIVGDDSKRLFSLKVSGAQLDAVNRMFGGLSGVEIKRGGNNLCLSHESTKTHMILSGMIY